MAIHPSLLTSPKPTTVAPANVHIAHIQLCDLIACPREAGIVTYVHEKGIVEQDIYAPNSPPKVIASPAFKPNALAALPIPDTNDILYATGGQEADLHFSYHTVYGSSSSASPLPSSSSPRRRRLRPSSTSKQIWAFSKHLYQCSINNSVVLTTSLNLGRSNESAVEPRAIVSNNDNSVKFFDVPLRTTGSKHTRDLREVGLLKLNVPINHTSLSPDARTVLSVGDSSEVFLQHVSGSSRLTFTPIATLTLPQPHGLPFWLPSNALAASFSTSFSADGAKFAVASQEGVVAVWDVRSTKPMKIFQTNKASGLGPAALPGGGLWAGGAAAIGWSNSAASGWLFEDAHIHGRPSVGGTVRAPTWSVRNVKFGGGIGGSGKEVMVFTEHSNMVHVVDAKTFETEEIVRVPFARGPALAPIPLTRRSANATTSTTAVNTSRPTSVRTASESSLPSGARSRSSSSPSVDYVYSQLPGFAARRSARYSGPLTFSTQRDRDRDRDLREIQERRVQRARDIISRRRSIVSPIGGRSDDDDRDRDAESNRSSQHPRTRTGYSPPSSIGDSTMRTLRTAGEEGAVLGGNRGAAFNALSRLLSSPGEGATGERDDEETALMLIPALVEGIEARDLEEILTRHGMLGRGEGRDDTRDGVNERRDEEDDEDQNTGSAVADFEYPYEFGDSSVWRDAQAAARIRDRRAESEDEGGEEDMDIDEGGPTFTRGSGGGGRGYNWITGQEEDDVDERDEHEREKDETEARERESEGREETGELNIAGVCFDPSGGRVYVASMNSVVEWNIRGAEKRWWSSDGWA